MPWGEYRLVRCHACDLVYSERLEVPTALYDDAYDHHVAYLAYLQQAKSIARRPLHIAWAWRQFFRFARPGGRLLDIGCATGAFLQVAKDRGWSPEGVDISPAAVAVAREVTAAEIRTGTLESCQFMSASFDAVTGWEILEHLPKPTAFVAEIFRILRPGGAVALSTPNWRSPWERKTRDDNRRPPYHLTFWSVAPVARLLSEAGFVDVVTREKPLAWSEEVGRLKWVYLPVAMVRSLVLQQRANRLMVMGRKPLPAQGAGS